MVLVEYGSLCETYVPVLKVTVGAAGSETSTQVHEALTTYPES